MRCANNEHDYNKRITYAGGRIVHAAYIKSNRDWMTGAKFKTVIACCDSTTGYRTSTLTEVNPTSEITCKRCLAILGAYKEKKTPCLFALREKESGYYVGQYRNGANVWVEDLVDAVLYKQTKSAEARGLRGMYYNMTYPSKSPITPDEYKNLVRAEKRDYKYETRFDSEKYEVVNVKLSEVVSEEFSSVW